MKAGGRFTRPRRFLHDRFSAEGYLGLHLTIGVLVILFAGWSFSEIAESLRPGLPPLDQRVTNEFHQHARPGLTSIARALTFFGSAGFLFAGSIAAGLFLAWRQTWDRLLALALTMLGGSLLNIALKHFSIGNGQSWRIRW